MASVDLGQSGARLLSTTLQLSPQSFTMAMQHVLRSPMLGIVLRRNFLLWLRPHHLLVSILNSAVPPLSYINVLLCLLQSISSHLVLHLQSINLPITSNFGRAIASSIHPSLAIYFSMCFTSLYYTSSVLSHLFYKI